MSIGLLAAPPGSPSAGGGVLDRPMEGLFVLGLCVLVGWLALRLIRPGRLFLRGVPGRRGRVNVLHVAVVVLLYLTVPEAMGWLAAWAVGIDRQAEGAPKTEIGLVAGAFGQLVLIAAAIFVAEMTFRGGARRGMGLSGRHWLFDSARGIVGWLAILPVCLLLLMGVYRLMEAGVWPVEVHKHPMLVFLDRAGPGWKVLIWVSAAVLAPVAEELLYRGLLQTALRRHLASLADLLGGRGEPGGVRSALRRCLGSPWSAVVATSALFAVSHTPQYHDMPALFALSLALGYNYERSGRLVGPMVLHGLFNAAMLWQEMATRSPAGA